MASSREFARWSMIVRRKLKVDPAASIVQPYELLEFGRLLSDFPGFRFVDVRRFSWSSWRLKCTDIGRLLALESDGVRSKWTAGTTAVIVTESAAEPVTKPITEAKKPQPSDAGNQSIAFNWLLQAAQAGIPMAQMAIAEYYEFSTQPDQAVFWYDRCRTLPDAAYRLAGCYMYGRGVPIDEKQAAQMYLKLADDGHSDAAYSVGLCYQNGTGLPKSAETAIDYYRKAASKGCVASRYQLGVCYDAGIGVSANKTTAAGWFGLAAAAGDIESQIRLDWKNIDDEDAVLDRRDNQERLTYENRNDATAQFWLAVYWLRKSDVTKADGWLRKAAAAGHTDAVRMLAAKPVDGQSDKRKADAVDDESAAAKKRFKPTPPTASSSSAASSAAASATSVPR